MRSEEILRECSGADTVVLFIHGIIESSGFFEEYMDLVPRNFSACSMLLEGHGGTVQQFSESSMKKWKQQVYDKVMALSARYRNILLVGHSMGSLFAIELASAYPEIIRGILIMGTPLRLWITPEMPLTMLRVFLNKYPKDDPKYIACLNIFGIADWQPVWRYIGWVPRYIELFRDVKTARKAFRKLTVPCWAVHSRYDEVTSRSVVRMFENSPVTRLVILPRSHHFYYPEPDRRLLDDTMKAFFHAFGD